MIEINILLQEMIVLNNISKLYLLYDIKILIRNKKIIIRFDCKIKGKSIF